MKQGIRLARGWRAAAMAVTVGTSLGLTGCSIAPVQAWQKEQLAHPQMGFDADRLDTRYSEHIYFSREGSSGGAGIGGGGCGCN